MSRRLPVQRSPSRHPPGRPRRPRRRGSGLAAACLALLTSACAVTGSDSAQVPGLLSVLDGSLVPVVDASDRTLGVAAVVRTTEDWVVLLLLPHDEGVSGERAAAAKDRLFLVLGDERVLARARPAGQLIVLEAPRNERALRPLQRARVQEEGAEVVVVLPSRAGTLNLERTALGPQVGDGHRVATLAGLELGPDAPPPLGIALTSSGRFVGFTSRAPDGDLVVRPLAPLLPSALDAACMAPGADQLEPDDGFLAYWMELGEPVCEGGSLPPLADSWGGADVFLALDHRGTRVGRSEVTPGQAPTEPRLLVFPSRRDLVARLVERDVSLTEGEVEEELARPVRIPRLAPELELRFELPEAPERPVALRARLREVDPDRASGTDRTPLGARTHGLRRVGSDSVSLLEGDASDFWAFEVEEPGPILFVLYREHDGGVTAEGILPGGAAPLWRTASESGARLTIVRRDAPPGNLLVRVRQQQAGGDGRYALLLFPRGEDPRDLVRSLFRLVGREAARGEAPYLGSREFAREVALALVGEGGYELDAVGKALLEVLGHRITEARHLALNLLEVHFPPAEEALVELGRHPTSVTAEAPHRALDAGLLLATRRPHTDESLAAILAAASDPNDPTIRLRALAVAATCTDPRRKEQMRQQLRALLAEDSSGMVRRALDRAFPPQAGARAGRWARTR